MRGIGAGSLRNGAPGEFDKGTEQDARGDPWRSGKAPGGLFLEMRLRFYVCLCLVYLLYGLFVKVRNHETFFGG